MHEERFAEQSLSHGRGVAMRSIVAVLAAMLLAGCASTNSANTQDAIYALEHGLKEHYPRSVVTVSGCRATARERWSCKALIEPPGEEAGTPNQQVTATIWTQGTQLRYSAHLVPR